MPITQHTVDKSIPVPLYYQLKNIIQDEIANGKYLPGDPIPTEMELSDHFHLSRTTVRQAILEMVGEGKLYRVKSKGTFVSKPKIKQDFTKRLETFRDQIERLGMKASTCLLEFSIVPAPEDAASVLHLKRGEPCILLLRKRFANEEPNVIVRTYLPHIRCLYLEQHDLEKESLYEILSTCEDTRIYHINRVMEAILATDEIASLLEIEPGQPIHYFTSIGYNRSGEPVEYSLAHYRGDRNRFEVDIVNEGNR